MFGLLSRILKRFVILATGLFIIWVISVEIFPALDQRMPLFLALSATYIIAAYGLIPLVIRALRIVMPPKHVPLYVSTPDGFACDPINIGLVGTREEVAKAMTAAGWYGADKRTPLTVAKMILSVVLRREYAMAPFSTLYLFGRKQDLGFQKQLKNGKFGRHHVRFWACYSLSDKDEHHRQVTFWRRKTAIKRDTLLWLGAASRDIGLGVVIHNAQLTHSMHPDTNAERELVVTDIKNAGRARRTETIKAGEPHEVRNRSLGAIMIADGDIKLVWLK
jgi:hypothetical protein